MAQFAKPRSALQPLSLPSLDGRLLRPRLAGRPTRRIALIRSDTLLDRGVECLLAGARDLELHSLEYFNSNLLLQDIHRLRPDVVLLTEGGATEMTRLLALLQTTLATRIIVIRLGTTRIDICENQHIERAESADLLAMIRGGALRCSSSSGSPDPSAGA